MFGLTILFLLLTAGALHFGAETEPIDDAHAELTAGWTVWGLVLLYPLYWLEAIAHWWSGAPRWRQCLPCCVLPPLRLGSRDHYDGQSIWLPGVGWGVVDDPLRRRVERGAQRPMLVVALGVLPLLAAQHYLNKHVHHSVWLQAAVEVGAGLIWLAFTFEFVVMFSIAPRRFTYARQHWLDLVIICFPLIAFLRLARMSAVLRMLRVTRLQQLTKMFRLRGTFMRLWRAVLLLELLDRVFRGPEKRLAALRERIEMREQEIAELRLEISRLEEQVAERGSRVPGEIDREAASEVDVAG